MTELLQWTIPCTICEEAVEYHCNTCGDKLCASCRRNHLKSNATKDHEVVQYAERKTPKNTQTKTPLCQRHPSGGQSEFWCDTCQKPVCAQCIISTDHKGHAFSDVSSKVKIKRDGLKEELKEKTALLSSWQKCLEDAKEYETIQDEKFSNLKLELSTRADAILIEIEKIKTSNVKQLDHFQQCNTAEIKNYIQSLDDGIRRISQTKVELEDLLRTGQDGDILKFQIPDTREGERPPLKPDLFLPKLQTVPADLTSLSHMVGVALVNVTKEKHSESRKYSPKHLTTNQQGTEVKSTVHADLIQTPLIITTITSRASDKYVVCMDSGMAWVLTHINTISLYGRYGKFQKSINLNFFIDGIAKTKKGDVILADFNENCIHSMSDTGSLKVLFKTDMSPCGICCLHSGNIVVTFKNEGRVIEYDDKGLIVRELKKTYFAHPWYIAENKVNLNLYICNKTGTKAENPGKLLAFHQNGDFRYKYNGYQNKKFSFTPVGVCSDVVGYVLVTDFSNSTIHILDKDGNFLQFLLSADDDLKRPFFIDVDVEGHAWIAERKGEVLVTQYLAFEDFA